jgi:dTMP kinase
MSGKFIVFEGVEGAGKTTQIQQTAAWLQSISGEARGSNGEATPAIITTREPGGTDLGRQIRQLLLDDVDDRVARRTELLLYGADRAQHVETFIEPHLKRGNIVLCDRFTDSTIAYQGYGRGFDLTEIELVNKLATGGLQSDLTLWLDLDVSIGLERVAKRGKPDRMERATLDFHQRVRQGYLDLADRHPDRIVRIAADRAESTIQQEIQAILIQTGWFDGEGSLAIE